MVQSIPLVNVMDGVAHTVGLTAASGGIGLITAIVYRWYARSALPEGVAVLAGMASVAVYLNATAIFSQLIGGTPGLLNVDTVLVNSVTLGIAAIAAVAGRRIGDRLAVELGVVTGARELDAEVSRLVQSVGRVTAVELPDTVSDIEGYDPAPAETREAIAGRMLLFPRRLTVADMRDRLAERLKDDYGVGHVDVDLRDDGTVEYLGVGMRASGLGPALLPGTAATAVRGDPASSASAGDVVQVWQPGAEPQRVATGELRGVTDDVVTLALDEMDATALDGETRYRLMTLPAEARPEQEFAAILREADETMATAAIEANSPLDGTPLGALDVTPVAVRTSDGAIRAIPSQRYTLAAGDTLYAMARPEALRRLEAARTAVQQPPPTA